MFVEKTELPGILLITPKRFGDNRGFFSESWNKRTFSDHGIDLEFVQDNHSLSARKGTIRGLHFQSPPHAQAKLIRCGRGRIFDVSVDVRRGSPSFGKWFGTELSFNNGKQILVPEGFLHGFMTLEEDSEIVYKCTDYYAPECDGAVRWNSCGVDWPLSGTEPVLSDKDEAAQTLAEFETPFEYSGVP